ncbi:MAG: HD-GYP domain-containing protein [bacterium]
MGENRRLGDIEVGDYLLEAYGADGKLLLSQFFVNDSSDIERLESIGVRRCTVRTPDGEDGSAESDRPSGDSQSYQAADILDGQLDTFSDLVDRSRENYQRTVQTMKDAVESVHGDISSAGDLHRLEVHVNKFMDFMEESPSSISILTQIEEFDESTYDHSVNVSILALVYGRFKGLDEDDLLTLGFGALLHDIGKTELSRSIIQKDGDLTEDEWAVIRQHPKKGEQILKEAGFDETIQKIALQHHVHPDGSGYPDLETELHPFAKIITVIDVYEALTARRPYRDPVNPLEAYTILREEFYGHDDTRTILQDLIQCMGLFPVGCLVELTNGDLAVVQENHPEDLKNPLVKVIKSGGEAQLDDPYDIDLKHVNSRKKIVNDRVYDETVNIRRVLDFSNLPQLREAIPHYIQNSQDFT